MDSVYVIGVGMIRFGKYLDGSVRVMAGQALDLVLADAGLTKEDIQSAYISNTFWGMFANQHSIRGEVMLWDAGLRGIPIVNCENACAGGSTALHLGYTAIKAGMYDVVLALGSEKITNANKALVAQRIRHLHGCGELREAHQHVHGAQQKARFQAPRRRDAPG